ncbi:MAG TPA: hypothetical protein VHK88_00665, partial [Aquihabitans sp.]|nr:hypothetical protein [Aquihabitans sp.]
GLTDAPAAAALTDAELEGLLRIHADAPLDAVVAALREALDERRRGDGARDDVALLLLRAGGDGRG